MTTFSCFQEDQKLLKSAKVTTNSANKLNVILKKRGFWGGGWVSTFCCFSRPEVSRSAANFLLVVWSVKNPTCKCQGFSAANAKLVRRLTLVGFEVPGGCSLWIGAAQVQELQYRLVRDSIAWFISSTTSVFRPHGCCKSSEPIRVSLPLFSSMWRALKVWPRCWFRTAQIDWFPFPESFAFYS